MNSEAVFSTAFFSSELALLPLMKTERKEVKVLHTQRRNCPRNLLQQQKGSVFQPDDTTEQLSFAISFMPFVVAESPQLPFYLWYCFFLPDSQDLHFNSLH